MVVIINKSAATCQGKYTLQLWQKSDAQKTLLKSNKPKVLSCLLFFCQGEVLWPQNIQIK